MNREQFDTQFQKFRQMSEADGRFTPHEADRIPVLDEDTGKTAIYADWDYYLHTNWAARVLARTRPKRHVDIGSFVYFASLCSAFLPGFEFYDARPTGFEVPGLKQDSCDLTALHFPDNSIESLSCLHVIEHIGLGRYGDKLDAKGDAKAACELMRVLAPGGQLLIVAPMNERARVNFNAHRIYSIRQLAGLFAPLCLNSVTKLFGGKLYGPDVPVPFGDWTACVEYTKL